MPQNPDERLQDALVYKSYMEICDYVGLPLEHRFKLGSGKWVIDFIKQIETVARLYKGQKMANNPMQGVEMHFTEGDLPPIPTITIDENNTESS